jgi:hypothetical protein
MCCRIALPLGGTKTEDTLELHDAHPWRAIPNLNLMISNRYDQNSSPRAESRPSIMPRAQTEHDGPNRQAPCSIFNTPVGFSREGDSFALLPTTVSL